MTSADLHAERAQQLTTLFPGHPQQRLEWIPGGKEGKKNIVTAKARASLEHYHLHLSPASHAGPGTLGMIPGILTGQTLRTPWAMLDFDANTPSDLIPFFDVLRRHGLQFFFNFGTTGRGAHVWFLLDQALTVYQAHRSLDFLGKVALALGSGKIEPRPSKASGKGLGVILPYRGAGERGYGKNALTDFETGEIIPLERLDLHLRQNAAEFAWLARLKSVPTFLMGPVVLQPVQRLPRLHSVLQDDSQVTGNSQRWEAELTRLDSQWVKGKRHHLTLAATAYGVWLTIEPDQIREDLLGLIRRNHDDPEERLKTIDHGLLRASRGESLAYRQFYEDAGILPPSPSASDKVRADIWALMIRLNNLPWPTKRGKTARSLLKTFLKLAWKRGHEHPQGIEVSAAWSQLCDQANIGSDDTLDKNILRLEQEGWLCRAATSQNMKSGSFVLLVTNRSTDTGEVSGQSGKLEEYFGFTPSFRCGMGKLGKTAEQLVDLLWWYGPQSTKQLAGRLATRAVDLKKTVDVLTDEYMLVEAEEPGKLCLGPDFEQWLAERQERDGTEIARKKQQAIHRDKQHRFALFVSRRQPV